MRGRTACAVVAIALTATLSACGIDGGKADAKPKPTHTLSKKERFLRDVKKADFASWAKTAPGDEEILVFPKQWCKELDAGHSVEHILNQDGGSLYPYGDTWGTNKDDAYELVVLAVKNYCPEYTKQVTQELRDSGAY